MAHYRVYHWYKEELNGTSTISLKLANYLELSLDASNPADVRAAERYQD